MYEMMQRLEGNGKKNLYEQIYEYIKGEIQKGNICCGERLPSTRLLAQQLGVSRSTTQLAYEQLLAEGYIEAFPYKGYFVCQVEELYDLGGGECESWTKEEGKEDKKWRYDFTPNGIDLEHFPYSVWRKLNREVLQDDKGELFHLGDAKGEWSLREAICLYLHQARGVSVNPSQVILGAGNDYLQMLLSLILGRENLIAMESPTYRHAYDIFQRLGYRCCTVSMDRYGISVEELQISGADIAYVMPSHQYPMGVVMPIKRRQELLQWAAAKEGRYIIEDDYDSEFRYGGKPIPSLQGSDTHQRVIYIGTFSKSIAPSIRISYLVLPIHLLEQYEEVGRSFPCTVSRTDQRVLQYFMDRGYFERHLNKMRAIYKSKHDVLLAELKGIRGIKRILGARSGVHMLLQMEGELSEEKRILRAEQAGVKVYPLSEYCIDKRKYEPTVILGYATMTEKEIREAVRILKEVWESLGESGN